ncbi:LysR substrate-binding domain-containing protein [Variovorax paradoxus]|uniref:LysR substrate-binding domain-containing protein n=1 Tax=Variovorax paradoxus TaxID=34073 RepID=UPI00193358C0|nr:LysR family transcriptional regulator [Variovorax paradoxus]
MEIRQLRYFVAIVECGSLSRAAAVLHVVQSALSQQMSQLEEDLGTTLLLRSVRGVQVTEAGSVFFLHAQAILKQVENARHALPGTDSAVRGTVAVGMPNGTAIVMASKFLTNFVARFPHIQVTIVEAPSQQLTEMVAAGKLDFSFLYHTNPLHGFETESLLSEPLCLLSQMPPVKSGCIRSSSATVKMESVELSELAQMPLILPGRANATRTLLEAACRKSDATLSIVAEVTSLNTLLACVKAGLGGAVLTAANVAKLADMPVQCCTVRVIEPRVERFTIMARSRDYPFTQAADAAYASARETAIEMVVFGDWPGGRVATQSKG